MDSSFIIQSFSSDFEVKSIHELNSNTEINNEDNNKSYKNSKYNNLNYVLPSTSDIYIFQNGLFQRNLLPIDYTTERRILAKCTLCSYNKVEILTKFQSSNFVKHYKYKHSTIAYNIKSEKNLKKLLIFNKEIHFLI